MTLKLGTAKKVVGTKQVKRVLAEEQVKQIYIAQDAEKNVVSQIIQICKEQQIQIVYVESMKKLGEACNIDVNAATAALLK